MFMVNKNLKTTTDATAADETGATTAAETGTAASAALAVTDMLINIHTHFLGFHNDRLYSDECVSMYYALVCLYACFCKNNRYPLLK